MSETITMSVQLWRQRAREGTLTPDEMKLAIQAIRTERVGQGAVSTAGNSCGRHHQRSVSTCPSNQDDATSRKTASTTSAQPVPAPDCCQRGLGSGSGGQ